MNCKVAVYHFRSPADCAESQDAEPAPFVVLSIELDLVATVEIEAAGLSAKEVAALAWIEAVGRDRQSKLIELNAPSVLIEAQVDPVRQSDDIREAPEPLSQLGGSYQFILDNGCESWLIQLCGEPRWLKRFGGSEERTSFKMVTVADLRQAVVGRAVPASETDGEGCLLGIFGRLFDEAFPRFPSCNEIERLFGQLRVRASRQLIKSIVVANDAGGVEEAWQLLVDALGGPGRRLPVMPSGNLVTTLPDGEQNHC